MKNKNATFLQIALTHFVPCFFLGVLTLIILTPFLPGQSQAPLAGINFKMEDGLLPLLNGVFIASLVTFFYLFRNHKIKIGKGLFLRPVERDFILKAATVGFLGGAFEIVFAMVNEGLLAMTLVVMGILIWNLREFYKDIVIILKPGNHATWSEVGELIRVYITMLAGFTLLNASLEVSHILVGAPLPFGFGTTDGEFFINSLYFTVVTLTTLGFGDFVPNTADGKLLLIFQCLVSYVMFALMVGIVTRGVTRARDEPENE